MIAVSPPVVASRIMLPRLMSEKKMSRSLLTTSKKFSDLFRVVVSMYLEDNPARTNSLEVLTRNCWFHNIIDSIFSLIRTKVVGAINI